MKKTILTLAAASAFTMNAQAEQYWADNSVSVLYSDQYEFNEDEATTTMTLEHVSGHSWGGLFYFVDRHNGAGFSETYGEFSPKFTVAKMDGFITSINLAGTYEFGTVANGGQNLDNFLYGVGADMKVPGLDYFGATFYYADNDEAFSNANNDYQITLVYGYSNGNLIIDGFLDYSFENTETGGGFLEDSMNFTPQITYNVGPALGLKNKLKVGVEYSYWTNQFGIDGQDQNAVSLLVKAHL